MSPTLKQKKAVAKILENAGNVSKAMRESGYAPATAKNPKELTDSKGYQELLKETITDDIARQKHREFLFSENQIVGLKALDMRYKVDGNYAPEKTETKSVNLNFDVKIDSKKARIKDKFEKELYESL